MYVLCGCDSEIADVSLWGSEIWAVWMWFRYVLCGCDSDMCCVDVIERYVLCRCNSEICAV